MKNYLILFAALSIVFAISSCEPDEDPIDPIIGNWEATSRTTTNCDDPENDGITTLVDCSTNAADCYELAYTFNADKTYTRTLTEMVSGSPYTIEESGTYTYNITTLELCDTNDLCNSFTLTIDGDTATQDNDVNTDNCDETYALARR